MSKYISVLILFLLLISTVSVEARTQVSAQLIWSEYDTFQSFGARAYLITYEDGTTSIEFTKGSLASLAAIWGSDACTASTVTQYESTIKAYDSNKDGMIGKDESVAAVTDYFANKITKAQSVAIVVAYQNNCKFNNVVPPTDGKTSWYYNGLTITYSPNLGYVVNGNVFNTLSGAQASIPAPTPTATPYTPPPIPTAYVPPPTPTPTPYVPPPTPTPTPYVPPPTPTPTPYAPPPTVAPTYPPYTQSYTTPTAPTPTVTSTSSFSSTPTVTSISFFTASSSGNRITVPLNTEVSARITITGTGSGMATIQVKKDLELAIDTIHSQVDNIITLPATIDYIFTTPDLTGKDSFRQYYLKIIFEGNVIYDSNSNSVTTYSSLGQQPITTSTPTPTLTPIPTTAPSIQTVPTVAPTAARYVPSSPQSPQSTYTQPLPLTTTAPTAQEQEQKNIIGIGLLTVAISILIVASFKKKGKPFKRQRGK